MFENVHSFLCCRFYEKGNKMPYFCTIFFHFSEYIVTFKGYYTSQARRRFLTAALTDSGVISWAIVPRSNPAHDYPSDFELIKVNLI